MTRPIRLSLLHDSATLSTSTPDALYTSQDAWTATATLTSIRIVPSERYIVDKQNRQVQLSAVLFFDTVNSRPLGTTFSVGQRITAYGIDYTIATIATYKADRRVHHYELGLTL
jgi:hypothetical protein